MRKSEVRREFHASLRLRLMSHHLLDHVLAFLAAYLPKDDHDRIVSVLGAKSQEPMMEPEALRYELARISALALVLRLLKREVHDSEGLTTVRTLLSPPQVTKTTQEGAWVLPEA